jgi:hypothetical protein
MVMIGELKDESEIQAANPAMFGGGRKAPMVVLMPHGIASLKPILIDIPFDARAMAGSSETFTIARLSNASDESWETLPTVITKKWVYVDRFVDGKDLGYWQEPFWPRVNSLLISQAAFGVTFSCVVAQ